jgi:hypothetical protein
MTKPPESEEPKQKVVNSKPYWWCPRHQAWVCHEPEKCEGKGIKPSDEATSSPPSSTQGEGQGTKQLKLSNALAALVTWYILPRSIYVTECPVCIIMSPTFSRTSNHCYATGLHGYST